MTAMSSGMSSLLHVWKAESPTIALKSNFNERSNKFFDGLIRGDNYFVGFDF